MTASPLKIKGNKRNLSKEVISYDTGQKNGIQEGEAAKIPSQVQKHSGRLEENRRDSLNHSIGMMKQSVVSLADGHKENLNRNTPTPNLFIVRV
jgi:hypothetical protein